jgi:hypothetical protein
VMTKPGDDSLYILSHEMWLMILQLCVICEQRQGLSEQRPFIMYMMI